MTQARVAATPETQARDISRCKAEIGELRTQLKRKECDGVQAVRGEMSEELRLLQERCSEATSGARAAKYARAHAEKAASEAQAAKVELEKKLVALQAEAREQLLRIDELQKERGALRLRVAVKQRMVDARDAKLKAAVENSATQLEELTSRRARNGWRLYARRLASWVGDLF